MRNILYVLFFIILFFTIKSYAQGDVWDPTEPSPPGELFYGLGGDNSYSHGLHLNAIFSQPDNYTVVVNGKVLHIGDTINGYKISAISKNSVTLKSNTNESFELKFSDFNFKQPHQ